MRKDYLSKLKALWGIKEIKTTSLYPEFDGMIDSKMEPKYGYQRNPLDPTSIIKKILSIESNVSCKLCFVRIKTLKGGRSEEHIFMRINSLRTPVKPLIRENSSNVDVDAMNGRFLGRKDLLNLYK